MILVAIALVGAAALLYDNRLVLKTLYRQCRHKREIPPHARIAPFWRIWRLRVQRGQVSWTVNGEAHLVALRRPNGTWWRGPISPRVQALLPRWLFTLRILKAAT
jgi:hypothetical protein